MITALSLRLHPRESGQLSTIIPQSHGITTRKMVPITGRASSFLDIFCSISIQIKPNQVISFFYSSFFLCLQGQPELCGSYHLLQSCFSFFVRLHGQPEPFGSYYLLQSCFSLFVRLHGQPEPFGSCIILHLALLLPSPRPT